MKRIWIFILIIFLALSFVKADVNLYRIEKPEKDLLDIVYSNYDVAGYRPGEYLDFLAGEDVLQMLRDNNIRFIVLKTAEELADEHSKNIPGYSSYNTIAKAFYALERNYPDLVKVHQVGNSRGFLYFLFGNNNYEDFQHRIIAVRITNQANNISKPALIFNGVHHAREPIGSEICLYAAKELAQNYGTDPEITSIVDNTEIWLIPQVNPDGYKIVVDNYVGTYSQSWRKNIRDNDDDNDITPPYYGYYFPDGVDLNRNYSVAWSSSEGPYYSQTYPGPGPFSEPETIALKAIYDRVRPVFSICYHTYSELILYPMGYANNLTAPDNSTLHNIGADMNSIIYSDIGRNYIVQNSADLYPAAGTSIDYFYGKNRIFAYVFEIGTQFITPQSQILPICQTMFNVIKYLADRAQRSIIQGTVRDSSTNNTLSATIIIPEVDNSGTPGIEVEYQTTRMRTGRFYRPMEPGTYTLIVQAEGYQEYSTVFTVYEQFKTELEIFLNPVR